jgi:dipeptidyl aminopeptidase/acylaminoacyl peptidase
MRAPDFLSTTPLLHLVRLAALLVACAAGPLSAAPLEPESLLRLPEYASPMLSADGRFLAVRMPVGGFMNLAVIDLETRKVTSRMSIPGYDVTGAQWVGSERLVFTAGRYGRHSARGSAQSGGLYSMTREGKEQRKLVAPLYELAAQGLKRYVYWNSLLAVPGSEREVIIGTNDLEPRAVDLYRVDVSTGKRTLLTRDRPERTDDWVLDHELVPRVATSQVGDTTEQVVHYRDSAGSPWRELWRQKPTQGPITVPLAFEADNQHLVVASNEGRDTMAVFRYDPRTRERKELLAENPRFDIGADALGRFIGGPIVDETRREVVGYRIEAEKPATVWTDERRAKLQALVDGALPGKTNWLQGQSTGSRSLVASYTDTQPDHWYLLDEQTGALRTLFNTEPWLEGGKLAAMQPFFYKTRDGLEILAYLFLPPGHQPGERLPTVVHIHGGPWARTGDWGDRDFSINEAQLLASHGYAVVLPNFRGSSGMGRRLLQDARGQFGRRMQEDIEDVTDWAVKQGIADEARICLSGASYGGYAALMGLAKTPAKYRCAAAGMPVTDLPLLLDSGWGDIAGSKGGRQFWVEFVGEPATDAPAMREVSPAYLAERMRGQVMLYGGDSDRRVPIEQASLMRKALQARGQDPLWVVKAEEGHGFGTFENRIDVTRQLLAFLARNLRAAPASRAD